MNKLAIPAINKIGDIIGRPPERWKGNCYCVSLRIVNNKIIDDDCRAVYGHYMGSVSSKSFFKNCRKMPFIRHGWILLSNGDIIDPTRWVFEAKEPYIAFIDRDDDIAEEYDEGGDEWRKALETPAPPYDKKDRQFSFTVEEFDKLDGRGYVLDLLGDKRKEVKEICLDQIFWLANLSRDTLGNRVREIYAYIEHVGCFEFIPIDNREKVCTHKYK
jgi:hypothetical protein